MKKISLSVICLAGLFTASAQDTTSTTNKDLVGSAIPKLKSSSYPSLKPLVLSYDMSGNTDYKTDYKDNPFEEGKLKDNSRFKATVSFPVYMKKKLIVAGTFNYVHEEFKSAEVQNFNNISHKNNFSVDNFTLGLNMIYRNTLFEKPVVYNGGIILSSRDFTSVQKVRGLFGATLVLKRTPTTAISAGLIAFIDPSTQFPVFPTLTYWHKFNDNWEFDGLLPAKLMFRRSNTLGGWLSLGTEFSGSSFFNQDGMTNMPGDYEFTSSEIKAGLTYEYPVNKFLLAGFKTGLQQTVTSRMGKVNAKRSDYLYKSNRNAAPYVSFSLSFTMPRKL